MFPRIVLHDARGTFVSLSHFCPTAASLLFDDRCPVTIVEAPAALAAIGELEGLDARGEWPPLLRPGVLMDFESYAAWEGRAIALLTAAVAPPREALAALDEVTRAVTEWTPGSGVLLDHIHAVWPSGSGERSGGATDRSHAAVQRWLAARLFGAWTAYQGDGLSVTLRYLERCLDTFEREVNTDGDVLEAIRRSDLRLLHAAVPEEPG